MDHFENFAQECDPLAPKHDQPCSLGEGPGLGQAEGEGWEKEALTGSCLLLPLGKPCRLLAEDTGLT